MLYGMLMLKKKHVSYKHKRLTIVLMMFNAIAIFFSGVMLQDIMWLIVGIVRFPSLLLTYGNMLCTARDVMILIVFSLVVSDKYGRYWSFNKFTITAIVLTAIFLSVTAVMSPDFATWDWKYAIANGYSDDVVLMGFLVGQVVGKVMIALIVMSLYVGGVKDD